jgi:hypothetical protein
MRWVLSSQEVELKAMEMPPRNIVFKWREHAVDALEEGFEPVNPEVYWRKRNLFLNHIARKEAAEAQTELIRKRREERDS